MNLSGLKLVLDCANGATYKVAPEIFWELGAEVQTMGAAPNGRNINEGSGALHPEHLAAKVVEYVFRNGDGKWFRGGFCCHGVSPFKLGW